MKNKSNKGLIIFLIILVILLLVVLGFGVYKYAELDNNYNDLSEDNKKANEQLDNVKKDLDKIEKDSNNLNEGYIKFGNDYKIYAIEQHNSSAYSIIVSYKNGLYEVEAGQYGTMCISKIATAKFDSSNNYECKIEEDSVDSYIYKFNGKEKDLSKVAFSISYYSMDGSKYPILIYKSGEIETINSEIASALKDYKIKDFISEKCNEFDTTTIGECKKGQLSYKVILKDGSTKTITK